jgi:ABC-type multidrug transport system fused ATPase/permease subunit
MIEEFSSTKRVSKISQSFQSTHVGFNPEIEIKNLRLLYPSATINALNSISLKIQPGSLVAIVGPSGAGKTSLIDVLLGVIKPTDGMVLISGLKPAEAIQKWPGAIAYVPQDISISNGTIAQNVALGYELSEVDESKIWQALETAQLSTHVKGLSDGIHTHVGERGSKLSGGQRQRLGIARALLSNPKLLVLDEATSALDGKSELDVSDAIYALKGAMTVVLIAHRLSTVRQADMVIYLDHGDLIAAGTFDQVRLEVPDFDQQAKLALDTLKLSMPALPLPIP